MIKRSTKPKTTTKLTTEQLAHVHGGLNINGLNITGRDGRISLGVSSWDTPMELP